VVLVPKAGRPKGRRTSVCCCKLTVSRKESTGQRQDVTVGLRPQLVLGSSSPPWRVTLTSLSCRHLGVKQYKPP